MREDLSELIFKLVVALVLIVCCGVIIVHMHNDDKRECEARGGHLVDISGRQGWFCEENKDR